MAEGWSREEVELTVASYFDMLQAELRGTPYSKAAFRRRLLPHLNGRTNAALEFKYQNVSAVLLDLENPYINGYKPARNYQRLLGDVVEEFIGANPALVAALAEAPVLNPQQLPPALLPLEQVFQTPPERNDEPPPPAERPILSRRGRVIDFARRDAENRRLGQLGEEFAVNLEQRRLRDAGRDDLASRVEWVARTRGDGLGYDVLSFDGRDDGKRLIEVKTTGLGKYFPFYVTANEVRCSQANAGRYHLYRVYDFSAAPRVYILAGDIAQACRLEPTQYRATR